MEEKKQTFSELINGNQPVLVDFTATWCGPCKMMKPILEELHQLMGETIRIIKIDIDQSPSAASAFNVQSVPTLILFQNGKILWRQSGVIPAGSLQQIINKHISTVTS